MIQELEEENRKENMKGLQLKILSLCVRSVRCYSCLSQQDSGLRDPESFF